MKPLVALMIIAAAPAGACGGTDVPVWNHAHNVLGVGDIALGVSPDLDSTNEKSREAIWQYGTSLYSFLATSLIENNASKDHALAFVLLDGTFECLVIDYPSGSHIQQISALHETFVPIHRARLRETAKEMIQ